MTATASLPTTKLALAMSPRFSRRLHLVAPLMHEHAGRDLADLNPLGRLRRHEAEQGRCRERERCAQEVLARDLARDAAQVVRCNFRHWRRSGHACGEVGAAGTPGRALRFSFMPASSEAPLNGSLMEKSYEVRIDRLSRGCGSCRDRALSSDGRGRVAWRILGRRLGPRLGHLCGSAPLLPELRIWLRLSPLLRLRPLLLPLWCPAGITAGIKRLCRRLPGAKACREGPPPRQAGKAA